MDKMDTERIKQRLNGQTSKLSVNKDVFLKIDVSGSERLLPTNEINPIVNVNERFNIERQNCTFYRLIGTINPLVSNSLFNLNDAILFDKNTWAGFNQPEFLNSNINGVGSFNYKTSFKKFLKEKYGWFGYYEPDITKPSTCKFYDMEPKSERFSLLPDTKPFHGDGLQPIKNWELVITYPSSADKTHKMVNGGLLIIDVQTTLISEKQMTAIGMACSHNLSIGDSVRIIGTNGYDGDHEVVSLGLNNGDYKDYYFVINVENIGTINNNSRIKRIVNGLESEYYFRKFTKIKTRSSSIIETDDYETYQVGFSENSFNDKIIQYVFNEDIDTSNLKDNLGRPLSEMYLSIIKTDSNGLFTNVSSGIETPFIDRLNTSDVNTYLQDVPSINKIHNGGLLPFPSHVPLESNITINDDDFYGDLVEYNISELSETVLSIVSHRFNTVNRETPAIFNYVLSVDENNQTTTSQIDLGPRQEGYFYQAHYQIKIREFSNYIEEGDEFTIGLPDYAVNMGDGRYLWRDLLDIGFNESDEKSLNYPFLNGCHYMYKNHCFNLRRQDQFGLWNLYHGKFPADPIGKKITDKFIVKTANTNVC